MCALEWKRALLMMPFTRGADVSMPAFEPEEDILIFTVAKINENVSCNKLRFVEIKIVKQDICFWVSPVF